MKDAYRLRVNIYRLARLHGMRQFVATADRRNLDVGGYTEIGDDNSSEVAAEVDGAAMAVDDCPAVTVTVNSEVRKIV